MFEIINIHYHKNTYFYIVKGEYMGTDCLTIFQSRLDSNLSLVCGCLYSIDYFLSNLLFLNRMYISDINSEEYILSVFYKRYLTV